MNFSESLLIYYKGERYEAALLTIFGLITFLICLPLWRNMHTNAMLKGMFYPLICLALTAFFAGAFNYFSNDKRLESFPVAYTLNNRQFIEKEITRFEGENGVNKWWLPLKVFWSGLLVLGLMLIFLTQSDFVHGIAIGLLVLGTCGMVIDGFAHQRAKIYTEKLMSQ